MVSGSDIFGDGINDPTVDAFSDPPTAVDCVAQPLLSEDAKPCE